MIFFLFIKVQMRQKNKEIRKSFRTINLVHFTKINKTIRNVRLLINYLLFMKNMRNVSISYKFPLVVILLRLLF